MGLILPDNQLGDESLFPSEEVTQLEMGTVNF